jgi:hypothetical protein
VRDEVRWLYQQVGKPSLVSLEKHAALKGHSVSKSAFGNLLNGHGKPRWATVEAFVAACAGCARDHRPPLRLPPNAIDLRSWRTRYDAAYSSARAPGARRNHSTTDTQADLPG